MKGRPTFESGRILVDQQRLLENTVGHGKSFRPSLLKATAIIANRQRGYNTGQRRSLRGPTRPG